LKHIKDEWVEDAPCSGCPRKHTPENTEKLIAKICKNRYGREKSNVNLTGDLNIKGINILVIMCLN
jgi:hypothetical protein